MKRLLLAFVTLYLFIMFFADPAMELLIMAITITPILVAFTVPFLEES